MVDDVTFAEECEAKFYRLSTERSKVVLDQPGRRNEAAAKFADLTLQIEQALDEFLSWEALQLELSALL